VCILVAILCFVLGGLAIKHGENHAITPAEWATIQQDAQTACTTQVCILNCTTFNIDMTHHLFDEGFLAYQCTSGCSQAAQCSNVDIFHCQQQCQDTWGYVKNADGHRSPDGGATAIKVGIGLVALGALSLVVSIIVKEQHNQFLNARNDRVKQQLYRPARDSATRVETVS